MKDTAIERLIEDETKRQNEVINLIASENIVSEDVLTALGSVYTNKYAEGYPGKRYYGGNEFVDEVEVLCQKRALSLFELNENEWSVNVQGLSGSPANVAVYTALVPLGEKIAGLELAQGGHLTHGHKASVTGKWWNFVPYYLDKETELIDYAALQEMMLREKPKMLVVGYTAYSRIIDWKKMRAIADEVGALLHVDMSHIAGLVAGGVYESPFLYADTVMTTTHKTLRGPRGALIFSRSQYAPLIDKAIFPGLQGGPHINAIAATAVALFEASEDYFKEYAAQVVRNAQALASALKEKGWRIISGGTDTHLFLMDTWLGGAGVRGEEASTLLEKAGIIVNKNTIPYDTQKATNPSGIRIGTATVTTQGMKESDMQTLAEKIDAVLKKKI